MPRIRSIKPQFFTHEDLSALSCETHLLAAGLLCYADDEGYFNANPGLIKAAVFPLRESSVSVHDMLTQLSNVGYLKLGKGEDGRTYGCIVNFSEHQRVNRPILSKIKNLRIDWESSLSPHAQLTEHSVPEEGIRNKEKGMEGTPRKVSRGCTLPDDFEPNDTHIEMARKEGIDLRKEFAQFVDYHKAKGSIFKDWDAALRTWIRNSRRMGGRQAALIPQTPVVIR